MKIIYAVLSALICIALIYILDSRSVLPAPLGTLLAPQQGLWQNAEPAHPDFSADIQIPNMKGKGTVYLDDRLVPHIFAEHETDAYFMQGWMHAKFRLWQMDLQTRAAAGRVSEIIGDAGLHHDRSFRRLGMQYAAEITLKEMEADPQTKAACDAYTAGVNAFINSLTKASLPIEYKLTGAQPELWSNLKTALFLKYMSYDLAARETDFEMTNAKNFFSKEDFALLFPEFQDSLDPIIPKDDGYLPQAKVPIMPQTADSLYFNRGEFVGFSTEPKPDRSNGSNNWAVAGSKTATGAPILANDPHLGLNLPSIWFEIQISTPDFNVYGASFPGSPNVIIGFNDSCAFGFTNGGRDVRDYYAIRFQDETRQAYWFDSLWMETDFRIEEIKIAGQPSFYDTVAYTVFGPVMYDENFGRTDSSTDIHAYAVTWTAHKSSNELKTFQKLNRAKNYADYLDAAQHLKTPGQNIVFAAKSGDIALRTQGRFPAKWKGQGDFIMPGTDSSYMWQFMIPENEVPFQYNPARGFVSSANQRPTDSTYPYYLGREYPTPRGVVINRILQGSQNITVDDMKALQLNNRQVFAEMALPIFLRYMPTEGLHENANRYFTYLQNWDLNADTASLAATVFDVLWDEFYKQVYTDEYDSAPAIIQKPFESTLMESIHRDSTYKFVDNIHTPEVESIVQIVKSSMDSASIKLDALAQENRLQWGRYKQTAIYHLTKLPSFSAMNLAVNGSGFSVNANKMNIARKQAHGPSWRMVIGLTTETDAWGVYPGGQSGNPGSKFYMQFIDSWVNGEYYQLWMMKSSEKADKRIIATLNFQS